jgi:Cu/Ag efflux protein CusF
MKRKGREGLRQGRKGFTYCESLRFLRARSLFNAYLAVAMITLAFIPACSNRTNSRQANVSGPAAAVQTTMYHGVGAVKSIDVKRPSIEIDHQDIKDLMPAMTMEFYVKDAALLNGIKPGDRIEFTLENGVGGLKITQIKRN